MHFCAPCTKRPSLLYDPESKSNPCRHSNFFAHARQFSPSPCVTVIAILYIVAFRGAPRNRTPCEDRCLTIASMVCLPGSAL